MSRVRKTLRFLAVSVIIGLGMSSLPIVAGAGSLSGAATSILAREPQLRPGSLGNGALEGLQYGDPTEGIDVIQPPEANNQGNAQLELPLSIPPGRGGVQPDLTLRYDSSGGNGWLGLGWDLNLGEITVDTRWGVPRYDRLNETETYTLDGAVLSPTAIRSDGQFDARVVERADFTRRVEDQYDLIIRHGDKPSNYWWEVRTKMGGIKWYGGLPDEGGPTGAATVEVPDETTPDPDDTRDKMLPGLGGSLDPAAVLRVTDDQDNTDAPIYRWALAAERDVGVNMMRYYYDRVPGQRVGLDQEDVGWQLYLKEIRYTATANVGGRDNDPIEDPAYQVLLKRDGKDTLSAGQGARKDVIVDGRGGFVQVTSDLLRRIEVWYGDPPTPCTKAQGKLCDNKRTYDQLFRRYNLAYAKGPFGKSLLKSVDQIGSDGVRFATNEFDYYDDMGGGGFSTVNNGYNSRDDNLGQSLLGPVETSALGSSRTFGGDVHAFLGFAFTPLKIVSVGASLTVNGGATAAMTEMLDLNGDGLPDKVFKDGGGVKYRPNLSGPGGGTSFGEVEDVNGLDRLSLEWNIGVGGAAEAHAGVGIQFSVAGDVTVGEDYFADVNNDGLVDLVSAGRVYFNHLEERNGKRVPVFENNSSRTLVPIDSAPPEIPDLAELKKVETRQREQSPLQDTVRMWLPPFDGVVSITGAVTFDPPPDTRIGSPPYDGDGLRVTIQQGATELWATRLLSPGQSATPSNVGRLAVRQNEPIYFRLQSIDDGRRDQVRWDPVVQYVDPSSGLPLALRLDADGMDVHRYQASKDFTLAGRPSSVNFPLDGRVRVAGVVHKTKVTTDDVTVWVEHNGVPITNTLPVLKSDFVGDLPVSLEFDVRGPRGADGKDMDAASLKLKVDSPIDVTAVTWTNAKGDDGPELYYLNATDPDGKPVQTRHPVDNTPLLQLHPLTTTDIYSANTLAGPQSPVLFDDGDADRNERITIDVDADVVVPDGGIPQAFPAEIVFTVKGGQGGLACKRKATFVHVAPPAPGLPNPGSRFADVGCTTEVTENQPYFFDFTTNNVRFARLINAHYSVKVDGRGDVPFARHWPAVPIPDIDPLTVFPEAFRGWASAGYNGEGGRATASITPTDFVLDRKDFPGDGEVPDGKFVDGRYVDADFENPIKNGKSYPFIPWHLKLTDAKGSVIGTTPSWRGLKDNIVVTPDALRSSRAGADDPRLVQPGVTVSGGDGVNAVRRVGITAPSLGVVGDALGVASVAVAAAPSFGLLDYIDMNGDGFPDVVAPGYINYTGPRGAYIGKGSGVGVVGRDISFSVGAGFSGSALDISANSKGDVGSGGTASTSGPSGDGGSDGSATEGGGASGVQAGASIGASFDVSGTFTNPADPTGLGSVISGADVGLEEELVDVNGDGLPDKVTAGLGGVKVKLNLGYGFSDEIPWSGGGLETGVSVSGSVGGMLGFNIMKMGFSGGISLNESIDFPIYSWADLNGDGILDRMFKDGSDIKVAFGTGAGVFDDDEDDFGDFQNGNFTLAGEDFIPTGDQASMSRSQGLGAGFDVSVSIGPLCIASCWIIVNPGVHAETSYSNTQVQVADINGDGYADSLRSDADDNIAVQLNNHGRTNLLRSVSNPLGSTIKLDYKRDGNTEDQPYSQWVMRSVEVHDGRPDDGGPDTTLTTYEYTGNRYHRLDRELLGYSKVVEHQRVKESGDEIRRLERHYRNGNVFESGLLEREVLADPAGKPLKETRQEWELIDLATKKKLVIDPNDVARVGLLDKSVAAERTKVEHRWFDGGGNVGQLTWTDFTYDDLGNVIEQHDEGEPEIDTDDVIAKTTFSSCQDSASKDLQEAFACPAPTPDPRWRISPLWSGFRCPTWTSIPATFQVLDWQGKVMRERNGAPALCDNSSMTHEEESLGNGVSAVTDLDYDEWGSYNHIVYPANADGERLRVNYIYEETSHAKVGTTIESRPANRAHDEPDILTDIAKGEDTIPHTVAVATFDGRTGRIASRTDANKQKTTYTYDTVGRLQTITGPYEQGTGNVTVTFDYFPGGYAHAIARHFDAFNPGNTIDTVAFADGLGRITQTKSDASTFRAPNAAATEVMVVSGRVELDDLRRPVKEWYPIEENLGTPGTFNRSYSPVNPTVTTWNLKDQVTDVKHPEGLHTTTVYTFGGSADFGADLFTTTVTDRGEKVRRSYTDVRENLIAVDDLPGSSRIRSRYTYDGLGQLVEVVDNGGNKTTHTYDQLGRRTSTNTPDGGLVEQRWDPAGNLVATVTPNLRSAGAQVSYAYDGDRLIAVDYPDATPDVSYTWGAAGAPGNGVNRVIAVKDGAREQTLTYDRLGLVESEKSTMLVHNISLNTSEKKTFTTTFTYDGFGRLRTMTYPDGELVTNEYDSGGLMRKVSGVKDGVPYPYVDRLEYDQFGDRRFTQTGNGVQTAYAYDAERRWLQLQTTNTPVREIQDFKIAYDPVGNPTKIENLLPPPVPSLMGGPSVQAFTYDKHHRLTGAEGTYTSAPGKVRDYTFSTSYDKNGNVSSKKQTDVINDKLIQKPTTYEFKSMGYRSDRPHQLAAIGKKTYSYDANGNFTGWREGSQRRTVTWDAANRMRSVADQGSTTDYTYDAAGRLAIERGPAGETAFVNQWFTIRNGSLPFKHIFAGDDRVATKRSGPPDVEKMRFFLHKDLMGSTNVITDDRALVYQHLEYFPSGEQWVLEKSEEHRTPYNFTGAYWDEVRNLLDLGERWYESREQMLYSTDPVLLDDPMAVTGSPELLPAYGYAESNPMKYVDYDGRDPEPAGIAFETRFAQMVRALLVAVINSNASQEAATSATRAFQRQAFVGAAPAVRAVMASPPPAGLLEAPPAKAADNGARAAPNCFCQKMEKLGKKLEPFEKAVGDAPLIKIKLVKSKGKGWQLKSIKAAPGLSKATQFTIKSGAANKGAQQKVPPKAANKPPGT